MLMTTTFKIMTIITISKPIYIIIIIIIIIISITIIITFIFITMKQKNLNQGIHVITRGSCNDEQTKV